MHAADQLSRRDLMSRVWLIQTAVNKGSVADALTNFDIALRTSEQAPQLLFPILASALTDDSLARPIGALLKRRPPWAERFIYDTVSAGGDLRNLGRVVGTLDPKPMLGAEDLRALAVAKLLEQGDLTTARIVALPSLPVRQRAKLVVDPGFTESEGYTPFNWAFSSEPDRSANRALAEEGGPGLLIDATKGPGGIVASQLLALPPGAYRIASIRDGATMTDRTVPFWTLACGDASSRLLATHSLTQPRGPDRTFVVPPDCGAQWLRLNLPASDEPAERKMLIRSIDIIAVPPDSARRPRTR
jgi:hypothetical protein